MNIFELFATLSLDPSGFTSALYGITKALYSFASDSIETGKEFDAAMSQVSATLGYTADDIAKNTNGAADNFEALRQKALEMGSSTMYTATQASEGLNILAMSGYDANSSIAMIEDVLHLAAAGSMELADAAGYVSGAMKGFADDTKDAQYYADLMAKGATLANTSVSQLGEAFSAGAATAAAYNQSAESTATALLRLAEQGSTGSEAATALNRAMADLFTPTDDAATALKRLGVETYDSSGAARDINDVIDDLNKAMGNMTQEERNATAATIFTTKGLQAFNKMTVTSTDKVEEWEKALASASDGLGAAADQYATMTDNLQGDLTAFDSAMDGLKIAVSDKLTAPIREFVQFGTNGIAALTAALRDGDLMSVIEVIGDSFRSLAERMISIGSDIVMGLLEGITSDQSSLITAAMYQVALFVNGILQALPEILQKGSEMIAVLVSGIEYNMPTLINQATTTINAFITTVMNMLPQIIQTGWNILMRLIDGILSVLPSLIAAALNVATSFIIEVARHLPEYLQMGIELIGQLLAGIVRKSPEIIAKALEIAKDILKKFTSINWISLGADIIGGIAKGIINAVGGLVSAAVNAAKSLVEGVKGFFGIASPSKLMAKEVGQFIPAGIAKGIEDNMDTVEDAMDSVNNAILGDDIGITADSLIGSGSRNGLNQIININQKIDTADELARAIRIESKYGLMVGGALG